MGNTDNHKYAHNHVHIRNHNLKHAHSHNKTPSRPQSHTNHNTQSQSHSHIIIHNNTHCSRLSSEAYTSESVSNIEDEIRDLRSQLASMNDHAVSLKNTLAERQASLREAETRADAIRVDMGDTERQVQSVLREIHSLSGGVLGGGGGVNEGGGEGEGDVSERDALKAELFETLQSATGLKQRSKQLSATAEATSAKLEQRHADVAALKHAIEKDKVSNPDAVAGHRRQLSLFEDDIEALNDKLNTAQVSGWVGVALL